MKRTGLTHRILALLLVVIMTVQMIPANVFAYGELQVADPGIKVDTLNKDDAVNWPIKIYDYLNDGMLFEYFDGTHTGALTTGHTNAAYTAPYGGGATPPYTALGSDFTYASSSNYSSSSYNSPYYYGSNGTLYDYSLSKRAAVDFTSPYHLRISDNANYGASSSATNHNMLLNHFSDDQSTTGNIRYMVMAYRANNVEDYYFSISLSNLTTGTNLWWDRNKVVTLPDSADWTYVVYDLSTFASYNAVHWVWLTFSRNTSTYGSGYKGMVSGAYLDLTHVGYFADEAEAHNYGQACVAFDKNPGEYLRHSSSSFTATTTTISPSARLNYIFSLYWNWKNANDLPEMGDANSSNVYYGMDFTTTSKDAGAYTNAYTTNTYWTWETGATQHYKYTEDGVTGTNTFAMDMINVDQKTESNGAMYVRLTSDQPSRILLSKFREDLAGQTETYIPTTAGVNYAVLVYRPNGLEAADQFALWAQGYDASSANADFTAASNWKYAGLCDNSSAWAAQDNINALSFGANSEWQYVIVPLTETIGAKDSNMAQVTRLARTGLYLPEMTNGKSLDLAYAVYFDSQAKADTFGAAAVKYMNSDPVISKTTTTKTYGSSRVWNSGNNKGFGMLRATGGGNWATANSGGSSTDSFGYETWYLGYDTASYWGSGGNATGYRRNPITGEVYTAQYTTSSSRVINQNATGTTNNIFYLSTYGSSNDGNTANGNAFDTSVLDFDGYELLETVGKNAVVTLGLLEGSLRTVNVDGTDYRVPVYRQETVEYIAYLLVNALRVPQRDTSGNYNTAFVKGAPSTQFGGVDLNGDGVIGTIDLDGDPRNGKECNEASVDLATALRHCLGITLTLTANKGVLRNSYEKTLGTYAETLKKSEQLIGKFEDCRYSITTAMDAAYYMLNSLFVANSFNQKQDDYYYLNMPSATLAMDDQGRTGTAYVFDAGFTTGKTGTIGDDMIDDGTNKSAIKYSPAVDANGNTGTGTIYMEGVTGKTYLNYASSSTNRTYTTRFPFLPVTGATGDYAGGTHSYYFVDDAQRQYHTESNSYYQPNADASNFTSNRRNYNYAMVSNGEFVYNWADALFFDFEGDDDVYLFINGELVMDNGAAHSITGVYIDVNKYVDRAGEVLAELGKYGYTNDMPVDEFDDMISADTLEEYIYDSATGKITGTKTVNNPYTEEQRANFKRWARLDLVDGEVCQFDFYYMERHGWGANMRIVTNMHITDPALAVDKTAYQYGQEIEYGGVIDPTSSMEYNFSLTNSGNQKLYNLTFTDDVIGVTLDPINGLTVANGKNGIYVLNGGGKKLEAMDLSAVVTGYNAVGQYVEVPITFPEKDGDKGQTALKNFLRSLNAEGTESGYDDAEVTHAGSGLWVDATVTIKGIHYLLTPEQTEAGVVHNTVYLTATTRINPETVGSQTRRSDADHIVYTSGFPVHYQWADHNIFMKMGHLLQEAKEEAATPGTQLNLYNKFFSSVDDLGDIYYQLCDKYGRTGGYYPYHTEFTDKGNNEGYLINYDEPGIYTFYLLLYMQSGANKNYAPSGVDAEDIAEGEYAIIRSQVYVADVEDSNYVLDFGLSTETLDLGGELFKNDYLFGPYGTIRAKLMGVTGTQPAYLDPATTSDTDYCRIAFQSQNLSAANTITTPDGVYKVNLAIPDSGKLISYDSATGEYTLTGVGTVTISAVVPTDDNWAAPRLYYWYDDGTRGPAWPGTPMTSLGAGKFEIDIPADVTNVIINNGSSALQTEDLKITPGLESTIHVSVDGDNNVSHRIETIIEEVTVHVKAPESWDKVYLHHWHDNGESTTYPGDEITEKDENGYWVINVHGDVTHMLVNDGGSNQSGDLTVYAGKEAWIEVSDTLSGSVENEDGSTTNYYETKVKYTLSEGYVVHASVPNSWNDTIYIYYWHEGMTDDEMTWPGKPMTKGEFGWYTSADLVPADVHQIIINDGNTNTINHQTIDLSVTPGLETWIMVNNATVEVTDGYGNVSKKYTAKVAYGSESASTGLTFTPKDFMDQTNDMWLAITVHSTSANPSALNTSINIHQETQMYKKISVIPATVVYYEDTFGAIDYNNGDESSANSFTHHGNGSGQLSQSIDPDQPYGQDSVYQGAENDLYSGDSMTEIEIMDKSVVGTFAFKGTGFEIIGRTNAFDSASFMARVYKKDQYSVDAYDNYMAKAEAYVQAVGRFNNVFTTYDAAYASYEKALATYRNAMEAYEKAKTAYDASEEARKLLDEAKEALANAKLEVTKAGEAFTAAEKARDSAYQILCATSVDDQEAYAIALANYNEAQSNYDTALTNVNNARQAYSQAYAAEREADTNYRTAREAYRREHGSTYYAFRALSGTFTSYSGAVGRYEAALTEFDGTVATTVERIGECAYEYYTDEIKFEDAFSISEEPTAPIEPGKLTVMVLTATMPESPFVTVSMVYTQFDHGNNGGAETINQVPVIRVTDLDLGEYVVELAGMPTYIFDESNDYEVIGTRPTNLYLDGIRIYQPMGATHDAYNDQENNASFNEIRDMISSGTIGVGVMGSSGLQISSGTTTWTESLFDNDFDAGNKESYESIKVNSSNDYIIQGPNNEVYMEGSVTNSAIVFYVKETDSEFHELQIAVRALDYGKYYGAGSTALNAQLQYGILTSNGYAWKNLVRVISGTEQYYSIPYAECPVDTQGRYQIVIRAVNPQTQSNAMVSYTNLKLKGLSVEKIEGLGESSMVYYQNGMLVRPYYELVIINDAFQDVEVIPFTGNKLDLTLERDLTYVYVRTNFAGKVYDYYAKSDPGYVSSAIMYQYDNVSSRYSLDIPKGTGEITLTIKQTALGSMELSYCHHTWGDGLVTREPNCSVTGIIAYTCTKCGHIKQEDIPTNHKHDYVGTVCTRCGESEPKFYLIGSINGADYGCNDDYQNMGQYLFVDGKLTVNFEKDSYVFLKTEGNQAWYMTQSYVTENTATFYNTETGTQEKMYVPCNIELTFRLVLNDDGSVTLTYYEPCVHDWGEGVVTHAPTCTEDGERTYTCSKCFESKTALIPATGHNYIDGICGCGDVQMRTIYFHNTAGWENVYIWAWDSSGINYTGGQWPGVLMTPVEGEEDIFSFELPGFVPNILITNNGSDAERTGDQIVPSDGRNMYDYALGNWTIYGGELEYYLVGYINGTDYGSGENIANMGSYKFVDGKLTVTFETDSYVFVKSTGNVGLYMTQEYCQTYTATLYNNNTGAGEKMFVPGGVELTFTLVDNGDDTFELTVHSWGSVTTKDATCTEAGEIVHTCNLCNDTYKEVVPTLGHSFDSTGTCTVCGQDDNHIIYFKNTAGWDKVYLWAWVEGGANYTGGNWPGVEMSLVEGETDLYYYELSVKAIKAIFSNGNGVQTDNLTIPTDGRNKFTYIANVWTTLDEDVEVEIPVEQTIYLKPNANWNEANARFAAYFFNDEGNIWVDMTDADGDGIYECVVPNGYGTVIFCRMNPGTTDNNWDNRWNQTGNLAVPTDGNDLCAINDGQWDCGENVTWSVFNPAMADCEHSYTENVTTAATCTTDGVKTFTCSKCGDSYSETIAATGHSYVDGTCTGCGEAEPTAKLYLNPGSDWLASGAWFSAYFYGNGDTWVKMTDEDGDNIYECPMPTGYTNVIFVRNDPAKTALGWDSKWNQTVDLTFDGNLFTIENPWDEASEWKALGSWSTTATAATLSMRMVRSLSAAAEPEAELVIVGDEDSALNLYAVNQQMSSDVVFGQLDEIVDEEEKDVTVNITSAAPVLSDDINLRYYVTVPSNAENIYMVFDFNGTTTTVTDYTIGADGRLCFTFCGINALKMGDSIDATLYATVDGVRYTDTVKGYSIRRYCSNILKRGVSDEKLLAIISDLLVYGAKAQAYEGYKTDALVTEGLNLTPSTFTELDESYNKLAISGEVDANVRYSSVTLVLSGKMTLRLTVETDDPSAYTYKVLLGGVEHVYTAEDLVAAGDGKYYLYFNQLKATAFDEVITASIECDGQTISQTVSYSVNTYIQRNQNTDNVALRELLEAIYNYGRSAANYAG